MMITNYNEGFTLLFYFFCSEIYSFSANDRVHRRWRNGARVSGNWQVSYSQGFSDKRESRVTAMHCCSFLHCIVRWYFYLHREVIFHRLPHDVVCVNWESLESWQEFFGLILQNLKLICVISTIKTYLGFWGERLNFGITIAEIQPKVWERRCKRRKEKMLNFGNVDTEIPLPSSAARTLSPVCPSVECPGKKKGNCGNAIAEIGEKKNFF